MQSELEDIKSTLVVDSFLRIEDKENSEPNNNVAIKEYCPLSILHKQYGEVRFFVKYYILKFIFYHIYSKSYGVICYKKEIKTHIVITFFGGNMGFFCLKIIASKHLDYFKFSIRILSKLPLELFLCKEDRNRNNIIGPVKTVCNKYALSS